MGRDEVILVDTNAVIWFAEDHPLLGPKSRRTIIECQKERTLFISAITFWEIALLLSKGRLELAGSVPALRADMLAVGARELAIDGEIAMRSVMLPDLAGDPADRFIVATALIHRITLMTADRSLLEWKHDLPRIDARQ